MISSDLVCSPLKNIPSYKSIIIGSKLKSSIGKDIDRISGIVEKFGRKTSVIIHRHKLLNNRMTVMGYETM